MQQFDNEAEEAHYEEADCDGQHGALELLAIRFRAALDHKQRLLDEAQQRQQRQQQEHQLIPHQVRVLGSPA